MAPPFSQQSKQAQAAGGPTERQRQAENHRAETVALEQAKAVLSTADLKFPQHHGTQREQEESAEGNFPDLILGH